MLDHKTIGFIGAGNMGGAMIGGLANSGATLLAADADADRLQALATQYGIQTTQDNAAVAAQADILVIAVKPQIIEKVLESATQPEFVLSIAAGVRLERLLALFGNPRIVRSMPNTPAMIGAGMSVWTTTPEVSETQRQQAEAILGSLGETLYVSDEGLLDAATAISGSGPAYMFLMLESMIEAGVHLGFTRAAAEQLAIQTMLGAAQYAKTSAANVAELRAQVTSPGGTTAEALYQLEKGGLRHTLARGVWAAYQRSVSLGGGDPRSPES